MYWLSYIYYLLPGYGLPTRKEVRIWDDPAEKQLRLLLSTPKTVYSEGEPLRFDASLENVSDQEVTVENRLLHLIHVTFYSHTIIDGKHDKWGDWLDSKNERNVLPPSKKKDFITVLPGQKISQANITENRLCHLEKGGHAIHAAYSNVYSNFAKRWLGLSTWKGVVVSERIEITII